MENEKENKYTIQSVEKACDLLMLFGNSNTEIGVSELSRQLGVGKSTVWKLLNTFENKGILVKNPVSEKYFLSVKFFQIACQYYNQVSINSVVRSFMERLSETYKETIHFAVRDENEIVYVEKIDGSFNITISSRIGRRSPIYTTAAGKAILANQSQEKIKEYLDRVELKPFTENTIVSREALQQELEKIAAQGYAVDNEEYEANIKCVGVPIKNIAGRVVGGLSVSGMNARMTDEKIAEIVRDLKEYSGEITHRIGYNQ